MKKKISLIPQSIIILIMIQVASILAKLILIDVLIAKELKLINRLSLNIEELMIY